MEDSPATDLASDQPDMSASPSRIDRAAMWGAVVAALAMCVVLGRVIQLQIKPSPELTRHISERVTKRPEPGIQGTIYDRLGRPLALTRFGSRVFIDPLHFPSPPDEALAKLSDAMGMNTADLARRIVPAMQKNQEIQAEIAAEEEARKANPTDEPEDPREVQKKHLKRYVSIGQVLEGWRVEQVEGMKIPGVHLETRAVREDSASEYIAQLVGAVGIDHNGLSGAEMMYSKIMQPTKGELQYVRDATGSPMWINPGGYTPPQRGQDVRLSIDLEIQRIVMEEVARGIKDADAAGARCVVLDPYTGEILAMADITDAPKDAKNYDWNSSIPKGGTGVRYKIIPDDPLAKVHPSLARNRCVEDVYEPGSTFKPFMWSSCVAHGVMHPNDVLNTFGGKWTTPYGRHIEDVTARPEQKWTEVLINSSNIGMVQGVAKMSFQDARENILNFGFGHSTKLGLPGETPGLVTSAKGWTKFTQTSVAMGYEVGVTPVQMVQGFAAFCKLGKDAGTILPIRLTAAESIGETTSLQGKRVLPPEVANMTRETMRAITHNVDTRLANKTGDQKEVFRYEAFGKSGTARAALGKAPPGKKKPKGSDGYFGGQYRVSFISGAPAEDPKLVVLVVVDDPGPELVRTKRYYGAAVAGPINRRIMERSLEYLRVPPSMSAEEALTAGATTHD